MSITSVSVVPPLNPVNLPDKAIARFFSKVDKNGPLPDQSNPHYFGLGPCWVWIAALDQKYGTMQFFGRTNIRAHRFSFLLHNGPIPDGLCVCHKCDFEPCVNPDHLFVGTHGQNSSDKCQKGRQSRKTGGGASAEFMRRITKRGQDSPHAKLTDEMVRDLRARHKTGERAKSLVRRFSISKARVYQIVTRRAWNHIR